LQLVFYVLIGDPQRGQILLSGFGLLALLLVVWVVNRTAALDWIAWALAVPAFIFLLLSVLLDNSTLLVWSSLLEAVVYFYAAGSLIAYMLEDTQVTTDELFAAGATFTLLAWAFAYAYLVCQAWFPGSIASGLHPGQPLNFIELLSLSFTNLSATGLSDILPVSSLARVLVMVEQFAGVGYIAVVVSRLVGLTTNLVGRSRKNIRRDDSANR
jgi:hypothetical protein